MLTRRGFLGLTSLTAVGLTGCIDPGDRGDDRRGGDPRCVPAAEMSVHRAVGGVPLAYEENGREQAFRFDAGFHGQLEQWFATWQEHAGLAPTRIRTYGAWIDGGADCGTSWHHAGRAFDIAGMDGADSVLVSCRTDLWQQFSPNEQTAQRRRYWALAASLHLHFAYVLTYLYDAAHANHIHVDNGVSGSGMSRFSPRSRVQNQAVQAIARYLWDEPCELTGRWDDQTERATEAVLGRLGARGSLTARENWQLYLTESIRR